MRNLNQLIKGCASEKGFVLLTSYMVISVLSILSLAIFSRNHVFMQSSERTINRIIAFNMAESAMDEAIVEIKEDTSYEGTDEYTTLGNRGGYSIEVCPPTCNGVEEPDSSDIRIVQVTGTSSLDNDSSDRAFESRSVTAYLEVSQFTGFADGVFARDSIELKNDFMMDSYDSSVGAYDAATAGENADVRTNSTGQNKLTVKNDAIVNGDAYIGPGGDTDDVVEIKNDGEITGDQEVQATSKSSPIKTTSEASSGDLTLTGSTTQTLTTGTYHFDSITLRDDAQLNVAGAVNIYVGGKVSIKDDSSVNNGGLPTNLLLYITDTSDFDLKDDSVFYGGIYAPYSNVEIKNDAALYGAVVADDFSGKNNAQVHYDEALEDAGSDSDTTINMLAWIEKGTLLNS